MQSKENEKYKNGMDIGTLNLILAINPIWEHHVEF